MSLKTEIIDKCKTERSRNVLLAKLSLVTQNIKSNRLLERSNGDEIMAIRTQLHNDLHHLNSGANKTYACEDIAGLIGLILMTRAWEGYLVGAAVSSSQSFKAFLADNKLDLEHVQYCLEKCARELMEDFARACVMSRAEAAMKRLTGAPGAEDAHEVGGQKRLRIRKLERRAANCPNARSALDAYISGECSLNAALVRAGIERSATEKASHQCIRAFSPSARDLAKEEGIKPDKLVQFALNYVVDQFKDGIPPDLLARYIDGQEGAASK